VDRGGLRRLETEAAEAAIRRVREAAYPLIFKRLAPTCLAANNANLFSNDRARASLPGAEHGSQTSKEINPTGPSLSDVPYCPRRALRCLGS
jgi:hypothetical protein